MSTCQVCGAWSPEDRDTGHEDAGPCPSCAAEGWTITASGELVNESEAPERDAFNETRR